MNETTAQSLSPEATQHERVLQDVARLRAELNTMLAAHREFGQPDNSKGSPINLATRLLRRLTLRSLRDYTANQHRLQGSVYRSLREMASILETQENGIRDISVAMEDMQLRMRIVEHKLQQLKTSGRIYATVKDIDTSDPVLRQPAWDVNLPQSVTASDLFYCFRLLLGRTPDRQEWMTHYARIGERLPSVVGTFLTSNEFFERHLLDGSSSKWQLVELPEFKMYVSADDDFVGGSILRERAYEPHIASLFRQYLCPGMNVLDIGANMGYFSLFAASLVGPEGRVYSWEPSSENVKLLCASRLQNRFSNIEVIQAAAASQPGVLTYFPNFSNGVVAGMSEARPENLASAQTVMALRIDDYLPANATIGFIKIDVEGYEYEALKGALNTIRRSLPVIVSEFSPKLLQAASGISGRDFLQFFVDLGYRLHVADEQEVVPGSMDEVLVRYQQSGADHIDLLFRHESEH